MYKSKIEPKSEQPCSWVYKNRNKRYNSLIFTPTKPFAARKYTNRQEAYKSRLHLSCF